MGYKWELLCQYRGAHICLEIGLKNIFMYWFALVSGADPVKNMWVQELLGVTRFYYLNKIIFDLLEHFEKIVLLYEIKGYWITYGGGEGVYTPLPVVDTVELLT